MPDHALLSPSSAHRWMRCPGSVYLSKDIVDGGSKYAAEGTLAHDLAARCLTEGWDAGFFVGQILDTDETCSPITQEMADYVQVYIDNIREGAGEADLLVETRVDFSSFVGVPDSTGTCDAMYEYVGSTRDKMLVVADLKYGRGVAVEAEGNEQLMLYALGALGTAASRPDGELPDIVELQIHQPRLESLTKHRIGVYDLLAFGRHAKAAAQRVVKIFDAGVVQADDLQDGEHCRFCRAKATCPKLLASVETAVGAPIDALAAFDDITEANPLARLTTLTLADLGAAMKAVDLVEQWCSGVRAETERRLLAGEPVEGFKLVEGRRGARKWIDEEQAEQYLRGAFKHDEIYKRVLHTPTVILDPKRGPKLGPRQRKLVEGLVTQDNGKPSVAPASDKRPALVLASADHFLPGKGATSINAIDDLI